MKGLKIGLTGSISCGKSSVLRLFKKRGWLIMSADEIVRRQFLLDKELLQSLKDYFGKRIFKRDLSVDRDALSEIVFKDDNALFFLQKKLHPKVRKTWQDFLKKNEKKLCIVEIPLLFENKLENFFDFTVTISCSKSKQALRLRQTLKDVKMVSQRIKKQVSQFEKRKLADYVISNQGSQVFLNQQVEILHQRLVYNTSKYE